MLEAVADYLKENGWDLLVIGGRYSVRKVPGIPTTFNFIFEIPITGRRREGT